MVSFPAGAVVTPVPAADARMALSSGALLLGGWRDALNHGISCDTPAAAPAALLPAADPPVEFPFVVAATRGAWHVHTLTIGSPLRPVGVTTVGYVLAHELVDGAAVRARLASQLADSAAGGVYEVDAGRCRLSGEAADALGGGERAEHNLDSFVGSQTCLFADRDAFGSAVLPALRRAAVQRQVRATTHVPLGAARFGYDGNALAVALKNSGFHVTLSTLLWSDAAREAFDMVVWWTTSDVCADALRVDETLVVPRAEPAPFVPPPTAGLHAWEGDAAAVPELAVTSEHMLVGNWSDVAVPTENSRVRAARGTWRVWTIAGEGRTHKKRGGSVEGAVVAHESLSLDDVLARCRDMNATRPIDGVSMRTVSPGPSDDAHALPWVRSLDSDGGGDDADAAAKQTARNDLRQFFGWNGRALVLDSAAYAPVVQPVLHSVAATGTWVGKAPSKEPPQPSLFGDDRETAPGPIATMGAAPATRASALLLPEWSSAVHMAADAHDGAMDMLVLVGRRTELGSCTVGGQPLLAMDGDAGDVWDEHVLGRPEFVRRALEELTAREAERVDAVLGVHAITADVPIMAAALTKAVAVPNYALGMWREREWVRVSKLLRAMPDAAAVLMHADAETGATPLHAVTCGPMLSEMLQLVGSGVRTETRTVPSNAAPRGGLDSSVPWTDEAFARAGAALLGHTPLQAAVESRGAPELIEAWMKAGASADADTALPTAFVPGTKTACRFSRGNVLDRALLTLATAPSHEREFYEATVRALATHGARPRLFASALATDAASSVLSDDAYAALLARSDPALLAERLTSVWARACGGDDE